MAAPFNPVEINNIINAGYATKIILVDGNTTYIAYAPAGMSIAHTDARWTCTKIVDNGTGTLVKQTWTQPNQVPGADGVGLAALTYS